VQSKVKVGPATVAGYGATLVGLVASVLVAVFGVDQDQAALIASAVWTIVAFSWTQWGRYTQARDAAKRAPSGLPAFSNVVVPGSGSNTVFSGTSGSTPRPHASPSAIPVHDDVIKDNALDREPPEVADKSFADPALDDPEYAGVPTAREHSRLKG
jgi:hypothetical protein